MVETGRIKKRRPVIECHEELIKILENLRVKIDETTYGIMGQSVSYYHLTGILAQKIVKKGLL